MSLILGWKSNVGFQSTQGTDLCERKEVNKVVEGLGAGFFMQCGVFKKLFLSSFICLNNLVHFQWI